MLPFRAGQGLLSLRLQPLLILFFASIGLSAYAAEKASTAPSASAEQPVAPQQITPRLGVDSSRARQALENGRAYKRHGDLMGAIREYQVAYQYAANDSYIREEARTELQFHLPLMRVQQLMLLGNREEAITIVQRLQAFHSEDPQRQKVLSEVLSKVQDPGFQPRPGRIPLEPEQVVARVEEALQRYRREHDEYPRGYEELNQLLPADTPPLEQHDIISYSRNGPGFRLEIRAKKPPYSTFRIEKTGLLR